MNFYRNYAKIIFISTFFILINQRFRAVEARKSERAAADDEFSNQRDERFNCRTNVR